MTSTFSGPIRAAAKFFLEGDRKFFVKGVTYGPFRPDEKGHFLGRRDRAERDLAQMREVGLNVVRIYHTPPRWFLDACAEAGMRVLITLPWEKHIEFLRKKTSRDQIAAMVRSSVAANRGHPAIFGYLVGNEIASTMIRWLGVRRVTEFVEHLIRIGRETDPNVLYSYASYPPTEFLLPQNSDFSCFNVYLHNQDASERLPLAPAKSFRRSPPHPRRIRHGHDPSHPGRTGRDARLAYRQRGEMRPRRHDLFHLDR